MEKELKRIRLEPDTNLLQILEDVHADKAPRLIERDGEALAVVIDPEDYGSLLLAPTNLGKARALKAAGAWKDLNTDALIERIYSARHEAPPSPPVSL